MITPRPKGSKCQCGSYLRDIWAPGLYIYIYAIRFLRPLGQGLFQGPGHLAKLYKHGELHKNPAQAGASLASPARTEANSAGIGFYRGEASSSSRLYHFGTSRLGVDRGLHGSIGLTNSTSSRIKHVHCQRFVAIRRLDLAVRDLRGEQTFEVKKDPPGFKIRVKRWTSQAVDILEQKVFMSECHSYEAKTSPHQRTEKITSVYTCLLTTRKANSCAHVQTTNRHAQARNEATDV